MACQIDGALSYNSVTVRIEIRVTSRKENKNEKEDGDVDRMPDAGGLVGVSFLFALLLFKTGGRGAGAAGGNGDEARSDLFCKFP